MTLQDTIVAVATPAGKGGVGIVRVSGPAARKVLDRFFVPLQGKVEARRAVYGQVVDTQNHLLDTGLGVFFANPYSYTGEDVAEFQIHGAPFVLGELVSSILHSGMARMAQAGEFTRRAFENGKLDLTDAERIQLMLEAETRYQLRVATTGSETLREEINEIRSLVIQSAAGIEARIEYPDEEETVSGLEMATQYMKMCRDRLKNLEMGYKRTVRFSRGIRVVMAGAPNAGKSTLFNRILGVERAIVTPHPGTTRDTVEAVLDLDGLRVELVDTAGLRATTREVEVEGIRRAKAEMARGDVVIHVLDGTMDLEAQRGRLPANLKARVIEVINKSDLLPGGRFTGLVISALERVGIEEVVTAVREEVGDWVDDELMLFTERQVRSTTTALSRLDEALAQLQVGAEDLAAAELRAVQLELEGIVGIVVTDDVLEELFGGFCLGK